MSESPHAGKAISGGFVRLDPFTRVVTQILPFQREPRLLARRLSAASTPSTGQEPQESLAFTLPLEVDRSAPASSPDGLYPWLSAFELLMYSDPGPQSALPVILFVWGARRIVPVRVIDLHIRESGFDLGLTPVAAELEITLHLLKEADLPAGSAGRALWDAYLQVLKVEAARLPPATLADLGLAGIA